MDAAQTLSNHLLVALKKKVSGTIPDAIHYPYGPVAEWRYGNGLLMRRSLNQNYQPGFVEGAGVSFGYEFDAVGNLIKKRPATQADPPTHVFGYDGLNRLVEARKGDGSLQKRCQGRFPCLRLRRPQPPGRGVMTQHFLHRSDR